MDFIKFIEKNDWEVEYKEDGLKLPKAILERYSNLPDSWKNFMAQFSACTDLEGTKWFLTQDDYEIEDDMMFSWDFIEKICQKDLKDEKLAMVTAFWDKYFPIFFDIGTTCRYIAIEVDSGNIVEGKEPDFMKVSVIASSFDEFLKSIEKLV